MYKYAYGRTSIRRLATCDDRLQRLFNEVIKGFDCSIIEGERSEERQNRFFNEGASKVKYPNSRHNVRFQEKLRGKKSHAVDVAPYINGAISYEPRQCYFFAGYVKAKAEELGIEIRLGADWDGDNDINDQTFNDIIHFELVQEWRPFNGV